MKEFIKNNLKFIIGFIMGILMSVGGIYAATLIDSNQVTYTSNSQSTVKTALDDLYGKISYGNATADWIMGGKTALVAGKKVSGTMKNLNAEQPIYQYNSSNSTRVIMGDNVFISDVYNASTNSNVGGKYVSVRYNGSSGYIGSNTLFAIPQANVAAVAGLSAGDIRKGKTVLGVTGTYGYSISSLPETTLYTNPSPTSTMKSVTLTLNDDIDNYDLLKFNYKTLYNGSITSSVYMSVADFKETGVSKTQLTLGMGQGNLGYLAGVRYIIYETDTSVKVSYAYYGGKTDSNGNANIITSIVGIKF